MLSAPAWIAAANDSGEPTGAMISYALMFFSMTGANLQKNLLIFARDDEIFISFNSRPVLHQLFTSGATAFHQRSTEPNNAYQKPRRESDLLDLCHARCHRDRASQLGRLRESLTLLYISCIIASPPCDKNLNPFRFRTDVNIIGHESISNDFCKRIKSA